MLTLNVIVEERIWLYYIPITFLMYIQEWQPGFDQGINHHDNGLPESLRALHNYAIGIAIHAWCHHARKFSVAWLTHGSWGAFHQAFCQWFSLTNFISYWNPCIWLAESKFVSENHWQNAWWNAPQLWGFGMLNFHNALHVDQLDCTVDMAKSKVRMRQLQCRAHQRSACVMCGVSSHNY